MDLTDEENRELARLISDGATSGRIDSEDEGVSTHISFELKTNKWQEE